ncbi:hypothetical protein [Aeromonas caviae]|uniref:hypothetical protein n=1 Tax=Aeromonas caviae TaxID=648 RepID=UPI003A372413
MIWWQEEALARRAAGMATLAADLEECSEEDYFDLIDHGGPFGDSLAERLKRFTWIVSTGKRPGPELLALVAGGVEAALEKGDLSPWLSGEVGRPKGISRSRLDMIAEVHFFRRLLPAYDQRKPMSQTDLAERLGYADKKSVRELEALPVPESGRDLYHYADTIAWLLICEGLGLAQYSVRANAIISKI